MKAYVRRASDWGYRDTKVKKEFETIEQLISFAKQSGYQIIIDTDPEEYGFPEVDFLIMLYDDDIE